MSYRSIIISSGHGLYVRGAHGIIDEVDEARTLTDRLAEELRARGVDVRTFHDNTSHDQSTNLNTITDFHNDHVRELDVSVHFNASEQTDKPMGTEVLFVSSAGGELAGRVSAAIAEAGAFKNRGPKKRTDLHFLNATEETAILLEICFVDSTADCLNYRDYFDDIVAAIADCLSGLDGAEEEIEQPPSDILFTATGTVSWFGGSDDDGVSPSEGLAFHYELNEENQHLFLPFQPEGTTGLARRLNNEVHFVACRWSYDITPKSMLQQKENVALVRNLKNGLALIAYPADWGPNLEETGRAADISKSLMRDLDLTTDDLVEVIYPYHED